MILTEGTVADCTQAHSLIADIQLNICWQTRLRHHGIVAEAEARDGTGDTTQEPIAGTTVLRPGTVQTAALGRELILDFKQWRGVATRYAKNAASFLAICQIRALVSGPSYFDDTP